MKPNIADDDKKGETQEETVMVDFAALQAINPDIVAWLRIPGVLEYPVVRGEDNSYYLNHTVQKTYNIAGSIFLDYRNERDFSDRKNIIYGHNMKDGSMFQGLHKYENEQYLETHNKVYLYLPDGQSLTYSVLRCEYVNADSDTFWLGEPVETSQLLLSTCGSDSSKRLVLFCELPEEQEESEVNGEDISMEVF